MNGWMSTPIKSLFAREFLTAEQLAAFEAEPQVLAPWDPMGALA